MKYLAVKFFLVTSLISLFPLSAKALTFSLSANEDIVGHIQTAHVQPGESLGDIGRTHNMGVYDMIEANPHLDPWTPMAGAEVIIPAQFVLPSGPREGIVLNLAEMRLYYYHADAPLVTTFPIGIGKKGWTTPLGQTVIVKKQVDPIWYPPVSIREEHAERGEHLPLVVPAGPDNPLGQYVLRSGFSGILLHANNRIGGAGVRSSHGCIHLLPEDIKNLYDMVSVGTKIRIIHEPFKLGWKNNSLYLEAHQPLSESKYQETANLSYLKDLISAVIGRNYHAVNWASMQEVVDQSAGYPVKID